MKRFFVQTLVITIITFSKISPLWGQKKTFSPQISDFAGEIVIRSQYLQEKKQVAAQQSKESETNLTEQLRIFLLGYVYDPRFLLFRSDIAGGIQERNRTLNGNGEWEANSAEEYELRAIILPRHPYNLELFTLRHEPMITGSLAGSVSPASHQSGAHLRYLMRPWGGSLSYITEDRSDAQTDTSRATFNYFRNLQVANIRSLQVNGSLQKTETEVDDGSEVSSERYYLEKRILGHLYSLSGNWESDEEMQSDGERTKIFLHRKTWAESLHLDLPWNFSAGLSYNQNENRHRLVNATAPETESVSQTQGYGFSLGHRLFQSLMSNFGYGHSRSESSGGTSQRDDIHFRTNYQKLLAIGKLSAAFHSKLSVDDRDGAPLLPPEVHNVPLFEPFVLGATNIEEESIVLYVRNPETNERVLLSKNNHYLLRRLNTSFEIEVITLPPEIQQIGIDFVYEFLTVFNFIQGRFKLRTEGYGYSLAFALFENRVSPFYSYVREEQELVEGQFMGELNNTETDTVGVNFRERVYGGDAGAGIQYQQVTGLNAEERKYVFADYRRRLYQHTSGYLRLEHEQENYPATTMEEGYTEEEFSSEVELQTLFPKKNLRLNLAGRFAHRQGRVDSDIYAGFASLFWNIGRTEAILTSNYTRRHADFGGGTSKTDAAYIMVKITRKIF